MIWGPSRFLAYLYDYAPYPLTLAITLSPYLFLLREERLGPAEVHYDIALLEPLDDTRYYLADLLGVLAVDNVALSASLTF